MVLNFLTKKQAGGFSLVDTALVSVSKVGIDLFATPLLNKVTGGNSIINAIAKTFGAGAIKSFGGKTGDVIATGMIVSAGDDLVAPLVSRIMGNGQTGNGRAETGVSSQGNDAFGSANVSATPEEFI